MKKKYMKPAFRVVEIKPSCLICTSGIPNYDDDFAYMPRIGENRNELA